MKQEFDNKEMGITQRQAIGAQQFDRGLGNTNEPYYVRRLELKIMALDRKLTEILNKLAKDD